MPFWKQSDDPWDRKPDKRRPEPKEPKERPIDSLKQWNEDRKAAAKEKEEAKRLPSEPCPWCGKDMEQGFMTGGRDAVQWFSGIYTFDPFRGLGGGTGLLTDGSWLGGYYKTVWLCRDCGKMVFDMPEPEDEAGSFAASQTEETKEEETSEE